MRKPIKNTVLTDSLTLSECHDGYWLYDKTRGMNLSMRALTPNDAFVETITYYQKRLKELESAHNCLQSRVNAFVDQFRPKDDTMY